MAFDGLITRSIVCELNTYLIGGKINKVYQPNKNELILDIYNKKKFMLNICIDSSNCRINLSKHLKENPKIAPNFCMLLRKYLTSSKIISLETYNLDRIVIINLENYNELNDLVKYKLIIELMGKHSNVILVNKKDIIIDSMRHIASKQALRNTLPANPYTFPISNKLNILEISKDEFISEINLHSEKNLINICSNKFTGISRSFMFYTLQKLKIDEDNFNENDLIKLYEYINNIIFQHNVSCTEFEFNNKKDFSITISDKPKSINNFIDEFYFNKEMNEAFVNYRNTVLKLILSLLGKYNKKLAVIQEKLNECKDMNKYKLYGELITSNLYKINNNINIDSIALENYYDNNNQITIPLDKKISPSNNAKKFFKKYNKLKHTLEIVSNQKTQIQDEISYLESIIYALDNSANIQEVDEIHEEIEENILNKNSFQTSKNKNESIELHKLNIDGFTIYIGKNNKQNDYITFKLSDKNDLWFHVQGFHGSHVLLKTNGNEIDDNNPIILKCAKLASLHSKASNENKVAVDYALIKNIKKPKGAKPGFVIFNNYKTIIVNNTNFSI